MGRHGGGRRGPRGARVSVPLIVIGVLVACAIGFAVWLWSVRSVTDPVDAQPVDAYAVVVSSPSCTSADGTTVIDLSLTPVVRSSLSACGRRVGERLAVQYLRGDPQQVRLAGTTTAHNSPQSRWLPIAIVAAGLLAVIGTIALMVDRRSARHTGTARVTVAQLRAASGEPSPAARVDGTVGVAPARRDRLLAPARRDRSPAPGTPSTAEAASVDGRVPPADGAADVTSRIAIPAIPGVPFRPEEIAVEEDLFTHRGPQAPDL